MLTAVMRYNGNSAIRIPIGGSDYLPDYHLLPYGQFNKIVGRFQSGIEQAGEPWSEAIADVLNRFVQFSGQILTLHEVVHLSVQISIHGLSPIYETGFQWFIQFCEHGMNLAGEFHSDPGGFERFHLPYHVGPASLYYGKIWKHSPSVHYCRAVEIFAHCPLDNVSSPWVHYYY